MMMWSWCRIIIDRRWFLFFFSFKNIVLIHYTASNKRSKKKKKKNYSWFLIVDCWLLIIPLPRLPLFSWKLQKIIASKWSLNLKVMVKSFLTLFALFDIVCFVWHCLLCLTLFVLFHLFRFAWHSVSFLNTTTTTTTTTTTHGHAYRTGDLWKVWS